jgi:hypothetical protein
MNSFYITIKSAIFLGIFCLLLFVLALDDECWDEAIFKEKKNWSFCLDWQSSWGVCLDALIQISWKSVWMSVL